MNARPYGKKSEKINVDTDQMNFFSEIFNEVEHLISGQVSMEPTIDIVHGAKTSAILYLLFTKN